MKTIELNIGLHSKTHAPLNPVEILNALTGRGFTIKTYRVAQAVCNDGEEPCLAVRAETPSDWQAQLDSLSAKIGQDCIAITGFVGVHPYTNFHAPYWTSPDAPPALSECEAVQAKHLAKAQEIDGWRNKEHFTTYLSSQLVPDLKEAGMEATAQDFETAVKFLREKETPEQITRRIIASLPEHYQDILYSAAAKQYHARKSETFVSPYI